MSYDENGLIDSYRIEYGDSSIYDGEAEVTFEDLAAEDAGEEAYRANIPGTIEHQRAQEKAVTEDATPPREEVEAVLQESEEAETRAQALITELRGTTEAAKALIEDAASITGKSAADFAGALSEHAAIVRGVAEEYQGKATVAMIRADHPELDFFDDEDIETIIRCGNSYTTTEAAEAGEENNMDYDYLEAVTEDVREYIRENIDLSEWKGSRDGLEEKLNDDLWIEDCVTGNASGSYTFSTYRAEQYLAHNWDLLAEALEEFGQDKINPIGKGAEWCDVTIRCYLLRQAISEVLDELEDELEEDDSEEV